MISELTLVMANRAGLRGIARTITFYPTQAEAIKKADAYNRTRLTPGVKGNFGPLAELNEDGCCHGHSRVCEHL